MKFVTAVAGLAVGYFLFPLITVCGNSMLPTYHDGEILLGYRLFNKSKLKSGDIVIFKQPTDNETVVIKRISKINHASKTMYCLGDNSKESYDSRMYGVVPFKNIICRVFWQRKKEKERWYA